jgi:hypothetical protein
MLESQIQNGILAKLRKIPKSYWIKATVTNMAGTPDIMGHLQGYAIFIEIKRSKDCEPSELQKYRIKTINEGQAYAFWASSWQEVRDRLLRFCESKGIRDCNIV